MKRTIILIVMLAMDVNLYGSGLFGGGACDCACLP